MNTRLVAWLVAGSSLAACGRTGMDPLREAESLDGSGSSGDEDPPGDPPVDPPDDPPDDPPPKERGCGDGIIEPGQLCFSEQLRFPSRIDPCAIDLGDLDGDGHLDVAVPNSDFGKEESVDNFASVLYGDGAGGLSERFGFLAGGDFTVGIAVGALDGPERDDIVVANNEQGAMNVLLADGPRSYRPPVPTTTGAQPIIIAIADIDHDGDSDAAVTSGSGVITVARGNGDGTWSGTDLYDRGGSPWAVVFAHFNGDEDLDMLVSDQSGGRLFVWFGDGDGDFVSGGTVETGFNPQGIAVADIDQDGRDDILVANSGGDTVSVLLSDGFGDVAERFDVDVGEAPRAVAVSDFDADGDLDLAVLENGSRTVSIAVGDGTGRFEVALTRTVGNNPSGLVAGDFNEDGIDDLAVSNQNDNDVGLILSDP